ncbi:hypothetical protein BABINDRAFT_159357 [Babjeviella inositovora NRRL Y-12698]|uniref:Uncharacterized protein n=1 Tax=Babjeviella inositovora NRRL Y-12698 TaxID=984486 RepID=A0A1E3QYU6_9ASCO|nr:uncharacterized protein BABINDRAFT_159357 [Babjeviella inositovora NRRL Y-12698]ODQ82859.1 hypothetical protein BABINDRAFT_159357 [Babjeviella inositovora NRRL Y-12698]
MQEKDASRRVARIYACHTSAERKEVEFKGVAFGVDQLCRSNRGGTLESRWC